MKHKHAEVIKAFADGIECEYWCTDSLRWISFNEIAYFSWAYDVRIKPKPPKEEEQQYLYVYNHMTTSKTMVSPTFVQETYGDWQYMGKVRVEK